MTTKTLEQESIKFINTEQTQNQFNSLPLDLFERGELTRSQRQKTGAKDENIYVCLTFRRSLCKLILYFLSCLLWLNHIFSRFDVFFSIFLRELRLCSVQYQKLCKSSEFFFFIFFSRLNPFRQVDQVFRQWFGV